MSKSFKVTAAAQAMRELRKLPPQSRAGKPDVLSAAAITVHATLFQPRAMDERHIHGLSKIIKSQGKVDPVVVWPAGVDPVLWTPLKSFSGVSDAAFSSCVSAGVPAAVSRVGPIRANA
jgi:hypothetical protein